MSRRWAAREDDLGPLHPCGPQIVDGEFTVVHGPLPVQQSESEAFMAGLTMGPRYRPRREHTPAGRSETWRDRGRKVVLYPLFGFVLLIGALAVVQTIIAH